jgi:acetyl esterase/lipase
MLLLLLFSMVGSIYKIFSQTTSSQTNAQSPGQPASGPGGSDYHCSKVTRNFYGAGATGYWLYEPDDPKPEHAPVIVFNHGWSAINPKAYGAWIEHLVRKGNIVIYPNYQADLRTPPKDFTPNAIAAVKDAINRLQNDSGHIKPDLSKFAIVGHSAGGNITASMAGQAAASGLPAPGAIMAVEPGRTGTVSSRIGLQLEDLDKIPKDALLLTVVGEDDRIVRDIDAKKIFYGASQVAASNKNFIKIVSDNHGQPALAANHFAPVALNAQYDAGEHAGHNGGAGSRFGFRDRMRARINQQQNDRGDQEENPFPNTMAAEQANGGNGGQNSINALDYYGFWKLFDGLCDAAFYNKNREYALGNTNAQRFMGKWSDGTPVKELVVINNP